MTDEQMSQDATRLKQQLTNVATGLLTLDQDPRFDRQYGLDITREMYLIIEEGMDEAIAAPDEAWNYLSTSFKESVLSIARIYLAVFRERLCVSISENPLEDEILEVTFIIACEEKIGSLIDILTA